MSEEKVQAEGENRICPSCGLPKIKPWHKGKQCHDCFEKWKQEKINRGEWEERPREERRGSSRARSY